MGPRVSAVLQKLFGARPRLVLWFVAPTLLAIALDLTLRARAIALYSWLDRLNYFGSSLASAGFWVGPLWLGARLSIARPLGARAGAALLFIVWVLPLCVFCYGGQAVYHGVFHAYMGRDTVRLGIALRGNVGDWLVDWGGGRAILAMVLPGVIITLALGWLARRVAVSIARATPIIPVLAFAIAAYVFWIDFVETRALQAAPPDTCFIHGVVHATREGLAGKASVRRGVSLRTPDALPTLAIPAHRPNVLFILSESLRADAMCSDPNACALPELDALARDRLPLGKLTSQASGTFTACVVLWTGLPPTADFATLHRAPVLWEIARAVGYRTAYVTSQNLRYDDFTSFTKRAGIDLRVSAEELGAIDSLLGAPDERAADATIDFVKSVPAGTPYFAVLHLSNTHAPYRVDSSDQPFQPQSDDPLGDVAAFHNRYRNSVHFQEKTIARVLHSIQELPSWEDTVVLFSADHGEEFREHGGLYHLRSLFDEQLRVPGWLLAGGRALDAPAREALATYRGRRTYSQDLTATTLDLLGVLDARPSFPLSELMTGRSLLRPVGAEPTVSMSTQSGVWEADDPVFGVMRGERLLVGTPASRWSCFDVARDAGEQKPLPWSACGMMVVDAERAFQGVGVTR